MVIIQKNMSYVSEADLLAVENGIAKLTVHSINLDRFYSEEEQKQNRVYAETCSKEEWSKHVNEITINFAKQMDMIVSELNKKFTIYQYKERKASYDSVEWDLFYWASREKDYVKLSPNDNKTLEQQLEGIEKTIDIIKSLEFKNIVAYVQYTVTYDEEKVNEINQSVGKKLSNNKFIDYNGMIGKIKEVGNNGNRTIYGFFKKGARSNYYKLNFDWVLNQYLNC